MNLFETYKNVMVESEYHIRAHKSSDEAHKESERAAHTDSFENHKNAAMAHDIAAQDHNRAYNATSSWKAKEYHSHMVKHHKFLMRYHESHSTS